MVSLILGLGREKVFIIPGLLTGKRVRMKILLLDAGKDLPVKKINVILKEVPACMDKRSGRFVLGIFDQPYAGEKENSAQ